ncbi:MAG: succinate dehydrogenase assembly factor 2 [Alphaproteobacteria bacterium]
MDDPANDGEAAETLRRRLRFRSHHRGCRELDVLLGGFADRHLAGMDGDLLAQYAALLEVEDPVMLDWIMGRVAPPRDNRALAMVLAFVAAAG